MLQRLGAAGSARADDLALVVSELVTNAVVHGPGGELELGLTGTRSKIRVEVRDQGTEQFDWPTDGVNGHWGLRLVRVFSERAGVIRHPSTVVWCELDLAETG